MTIKCKRCKSDAKIISASQNFWKMCLYSIICAVILSSVTNAMLDIR